MDFLDYVILFSLLITGVAVSMGGPLWLFISAGVVMAYVRHIAKREFLRGRRDGWLHAGG